jgi:hypothetical protein
MTAGFAGLGRELAATDRDDVAALLAPLAVAARVVTALAAEAATGDLPAALVSTLVSALVSSLVPTFVPTLVTTLEAAFFSI